MLPENVPATVPSGLDARALFTADRDTLVQALGHYAETRGVFIEWLLSNLVPGIDYQLIHRKIGRRPNDKLCPERKDPTGRRCAACGGKATLCKPGAEKLCGLLRLTPRFKRDEDTWVMLGSEAGMLCYVCELTSADGGVVAEGRGARSIARDDHDANKTIKMAQKSAQIDATLRVAGLSEVFTQDLEDMPAFRETASDDDHSGFGAPPKRAAPAPAPREPGADDDEPITDPAGEMRAAQAQLTALHNELPFAPSGRELPPKPSDAISEARVRRLYALMREATHNDAELEELKQQLKAAVQRRWRREHLEHLSWRNYDEVCGWVMAGNVPV